MPQPLLITLIVIAGIIGLWFLLLVVNLIFVFSYLAIFRKHKNAIAVILFTKYENIGKLIAIIKQSNIEIDGKLEANYKEIPQNAFENPESEVYIKAKDTLSYLKDEIVFLVNQHPELLENPEFVQARNNVNDADLIYRSNVVMYNADVLGYNYWIRFLPCRFIFKLFRYKKKEIIS